jgi:hypothetical protein
MEYLVESFSRLCRRTKTLEETLHVFESFVYDTPAFPEFLDVLLRGLGGEDFYTNAKFVTDESYGVKLPASNIQDIDAWIISADLAEESWNWEYKNKIEECNRGWFRSKSRIIEINKQWESRKETISRYINEVRPIFPDLFPSKDLLISLKSRELQSCLGLGAAEKSYAAIKEGVKLKHLLLEEGLEQANLWNTVCKGL